MNHHAAKNIVIVGFDCAHYGDFVPNMPVCIGTVYRDVGYVTNEVTMLAKQLKALHQATTS